MRKLTLTALLLALSLNLKNIKYFNKNAFNENHKEIYRTEIEETFDKLREVEYISSLEFYNKYYLQTPKETDSLKKGNCFAKTAYEFDLLNKKGLKTRIAVGKINRGDTLFHSWLEYIAGGEKFIIECSKNGAIHKRDNLQKDKYIYAMLGDVLIEKIKDFEERSGMKLDFKNYDFKNLTN